MNERLEIVSLDVGHGDATLLTWHPDRGAPYHALVDGGPAGGGDVLKVALAQRGVQRLNLLVLSHVDADHIDGLLALVRSGAVEVETFWSPCLEAFERHAWLFPERVKAGLRKGRELLEALRDRGTHVLYPFEGHSERSPDRGLHIRVLWPAPRLLERLLLGTDALDLLLGHPMPQGWLLAPREEPPIEEPPAQAETRSSLTSDYALAPGAVAAAGPVVSGTSPMALAADWSHRADSEPEFFGNGALNDTSLVLAVDATPGGVRRTVLLPGDLENWCYLIAQHDRGLECDVLKAPHHGGRVYVERPDVAYDAVYQWLRPRVVAVSANGRHGLPRSEWREAALRWGATVFCPCTRRREIVVGDRTSVESCHKVFGCTPAADATTFVLTAEGVEGDRPACSSEATVAGARVVRVVQHVVDPSEIIDRFTDGELRKHVTWLEKELARHHAERVGRLGHAHAPEPVDVSVLERRAREVGRHRLAADVGTVLKRAHAEGTLWYKPGRASAYRRPSATHVDKAWAWMQRHAGVLVGVEGGSSPEGVGPDEVLERVRTDALAEEYAAVSAYPACTFGELFWPSLSGRLREQWHAYRVEYARDSGYKPPMVCFSKAQTVDALGHELLAGVPERAWVAYSEGRREVRRIYGGLGKDAAEHVAPLSELRLCLFALDVRSVRAPRGYGPHNTATEREDLLVAGFPRLVQVAREEALEGIAQSFQLLW